MRDCASEALAVWHMWAFLKVRGLFKRIYRGCVLLEYMVAQRFTRIVFLRIWGLFLGGHIIRLSIVYCDALWLETPPHMGWKG